MKNVLISVIILFLLAGCATQKKIHVSSSSISQDSLLNQAFVGFKLIDLRTQKVIEEKNAHQYFIPASNTKLLTMYATMQTFADSIPGWYIGEDQHTVYIEPNGDPTFLHPDFKEQKLFDKLQKTNKNIVLILPNEKRFGRFGTGWSWSSWRDTYSLERSVMPMYANMVGFYKSGSVFKSSPSMFSDSLVWDSSLSDAAYVSVSRAEKSNTYYLRRSDNRNNLVAGFTVGEEDSISYLLLQDTLKKLNPNSNIQLVRKRPDAVKFRDFYSARTDDVLKTMMKRSDNFIAEQLLLMVGKYKKSVFADFGTIQDLRQGIFEDVLSGSRWSDGSGLSRSNLISPNEFINLLSKIYKQGEMNRVWAIMPSGNEGTLKGLYIGYEPYISAKTGTLSDHLGLSGYLKTKKNQILAFSFLINNHRGNATDYRKKIQEILQRYIDEI